MTKPKAPAEPKVPKAWKCSICGHVYEGAELPKDYVCPLCGHGPEDFEPVSSDFTDDNSREHLIWVSPDTPMTIYPEFFRSELSHPEKYVKHIVTKDI